MKSKLIIYLAFLGMISLFASCEKDGDKVVMLTDPAAPTIQTLPDLTLTRANGTNILTFVGTFGKWHGVEVLAHTIRKLFEVDSKWLKDKHVKFLLIGDGACMPEAKNILSPIPQYSNIVTLTGLIPQEDTPAYLALSDILISPHFSPTNKGKRFFGSPTKLFEYMAMRKVIIASDLEQISEVLAPSVHINNIENNC